MNYIGSKYSLLDFISGGIAKVVTPDKSLVFADIFAGTGAVGAFYKKLGLKIVANDIQYYSFILNRHLIQNGSKLNTSLFDYFNSLPEVEGFVYKNYCAGSNSGRNYFSDHNGKKCDAIRIEIENMHKRGQLDDDNYYFYLASLLNSIDKYANTASVYGAFLKHMKKSAQKEFKLEPMPIISGRKGRVFNEDANSLIKSLHGDILYLDPPYNTRQYYANYHVLETIARYDDPALKGVTGLRTNDDKLKSAFCSRRTVKKAFEDLIANAKFKYVFFSYSNEGLMSPQSIKQIMSKFGKYSCYTCPHKRFKADKEKTAPKKETVEYLHCLIKD